METAKKQTGYYPGRRMLGVGDFENLEEGSAEAVRVAQNVVYQSASLLLVCSMAFNEVFSDARSYEYLDQASEATAIIAMKCWDDLTVAASMMG